MHITALPVVAPLVAAAVLVGARRWTPRIVNDVGAAGVGVAVATMCALLLHRALEHPFAYWMGGWKPSHMVAIGISFSTQLESGMLRKKIRS